MDIALYARVLSHWFITFFGFVLAIALSFFSIASVSPWRPLPAGRNLAGAVEADDQKGFTFGRSVLPMAIPPAAANKVETVVPK